MGDDPREPQQRPPPSDEELPQRAVVEKFRRWRCALKSEFDRKIGKPPRDELLRKQFDEDFNNPDDPTRNLKSMGGPANHDSGPPRKPHEYEVGGPFGDTHVAAWMRQQDEKRAADAERERRAQKPNDPLGIGQPPSLDNAAQDALLEAYAPKPPAVDDANLPPIGTLARALYYFTHAGPTRPRPLAPLPLPVSSATPKTTPKPSRRRSDGSKKKTAASKATKEKAEQERHRQSIALGVGSLCAGTGVLGLIGLLAVAAPPPATLWDSVYWKTLWFPALVVICLWAIVIGLYALASIRRPIPSPVGPIAAAIIMTALTSAPVFLHFASQSPRSTAAPIRIIHAEVIGSRGDHAEPLLASKIQVFNDGEPGTMRFISAEAIGASVNDEIKRAANIGQVKSLAAQPPKALLSPSRMEKGLNTFSSPPLTVTEAQFKHYIAGQATFYFAGTLEVESPTGKWSVALCGYSPGDPKTVLQC